MAKKRTRKKYTSKGIVGQSRMKSLKTDATKMANKIAAWAAGKPVMLTVANPSKEERNKPFIRVSADSYWGPFDQRKRKKDA